jgi:asparagine synthase (glutamine-hydrolysing)
MLPPLTCRRFASADDPNPSTVERFGVYNEKDAQEHRTDTVYRRQKHSFFAPIEIKGGLYELVQDTLRGRTLASVPFFDPRAVADLLDGLPRIDDQATRDRVFPLLLLMTSACILHERYRL